jgi:multidrug resistance efflux pump
MADSIHVGDKVKICLDAKFGEREGWYEGVVVRIDPYSEHRSFYWVKLDEAARSALGIGQISVFNPKHITPLA